VDFELNEEQKILRETARDFLKNECSKELVRQMDESDAGYSSELWRKMADLGWMGLILPEEYGGSGWTFLDLVVLLEEMGYNICPGPFFSTVILGALPVLAAGSEEQKQRLLPRIAAGETIMTMALAEPGARYDAASIGAVAVADADGYLLNGTKLFVLDANVSDYILCAARTGEGPEPEEGISLLLVDAGSPGVECTLLKTIARDKQCEVIFDNVRVPAEKIIGGLNRGWPIVKDVLAKAAIGRSAQMVGGAQAAMDMALDYAKQRIQFDRPIGSFQAVQHHFADMWVDIYGSRHLTYKAAWQITKGLPSDKMVAMAKARTGEAYRKVTTIAHQIFGAIGFTMEHDMHLYYRRALAGDMIFGNSDFQKEEVAKSLGL
jgi:alkylation response protein AidB-like acyl-CoA dehydrogenase